MPSLPEIQQMYGDALFSRQEAALANHMHANGIAPERRINVYRNSVIAGLTEALRAIFPVINRLVGAEFFNHAARHYIERFPSPSGNIHDFGAEFPGFLATFPGADNLIYLPDIARLEWACHRVFHERDHAPLNLAALAEVMPADYSQLRWRLHPASRLLTSSFPIRRIWQANQGDTECMETVDLSDGGVQLLVIRRGYEIDLETLGPGEFALLDALADRHTLADACKQALIIEPGFDVTMCMQWHVSQSTLVDFDL